MRLLSGVLLAILAGCASAQSPAMPGAMTPGAAVAPARSAANDGAREANSPKNWSLIYVSNAVGTVTVYRYWQRLYYATLTGFATPKGECTDQTGDVFITDSTLEEIVEYGHGGSTPINVISDAGYQPYACSVDPTSGKLAVANYLDAKGDAGNVAIYKTFNSKPQYYNPFLEGYGPLTCAYDDNGNLLIATEYSVGSYEYAALSRLKRYYHRFVRVDMPYIKKERPYEYITNVQWDGKYWAITSAGNISRFTITNLIDRYEGTTTLSANENGPGQVWISNATGDLSEQGTQVVAAESSGAVLYWKYPAGGSAFASISDYLDAPYGVAVSPKISSGSER